MPTKHKPSSWQPSDIEVLKSFNALYDNARLDRILDAGPKRIDPQREAKLRERMFYIALELFISKEQAGRPSVPEKRATLTVLHTQARTLFKTLRSLDHDTERELWKSAGPDGDIHLYEVQRQIIKLRRWIGKTDRSLGETPKGRPLDTALRSAVNDLHDAWANAAGKTPTYNPFINFVSLALKPIVGNVDFEGPCREVLYGEKAGKRHPH